MKTAQQDLSGQINHLFRTLNQSLIEIDSVPFRSSTTSIEWWGGSSTYIDTIHFVGCVSSSVIDEFSASNHIHYLSSSAYTNVILNTNTNSIVENPFTATHTESERQVKSDMFFANFATNSLPLFFGKSDLVKIPSKIIYALEKAPARVLKEIHPDRRTSIELCLMFTSQLTSTYFEIKQGSNPDGWKSLSSVYLKELLEIDSTCYKRIREALEFNLPNGPIIECDYKYTSSLKNYHYRLGSYYTDKKIHSNKLTTVDAKKLLQKHYLKAFARASDNIICRNLFYMYSKIELPTIEQIEKEANRLMKIMFKTKKGKKLIRRNKKANSFFSNREELSFVEDAIEIYQYLTSDNGIRIPTVGGDASGGRIVDSFTLMPSWIRNMVTINGNKLVECDYSCLHPNIAMHLYGGSSQFLTHQQLAEYLQMDVLEVKIEHLSFFNRPIWQMKQSPLWKFYQENEPMMLENLIGEKACNFLDKKDRHKITSMRLFKKEVEIMTDAIEILNQEGIFVIYVYDALYSEERHKMRVQQVMNEVALEHSLYTQAKC